MTESILQSHCVRTVFKAQLLLSLSDCFVLTLPRVFLLSHNRWLSVLWVLWSCLLNVVVNVIRVFVYWQRYCYIIYHASPLFMFDNATQNNRCQTEVHSLRLYYIAVIYWAFKHCIIRCVVANVEFFCCVCISCVCFTGSEVTVIID